MNTGHVSAADEQLDCAIRAVRARFGGTQEPSLALLAGYMQLLAMSELTDEVRRLNAAVEDLGEKVAQGCETVEGAVMSLCASL